MVSCSCEGHTLNHPGKEASVLSRPKLTYTFVNPNTAEVTADALLKVFIEANQPKADAAIRRALQEPEAPREAPPEQRPSIRKELAALRAEAAAQAHSCPTPGYAPPGRSERT